MLARLWSVAGHSHAHRPAVAARLEYALSGLGIIDLLAFLPAAIALVTGDRRALALFGMLPFFKLVRYSPAMRSLLAALHAERRALFGCIVILTGAVLLFASLLYAIEHNVQPDKLGTIPQAMWWAIVTLGTVGYGDVVPVTPLGKMVVGVRDHRRLCHDRAAGRDHLAPPLPTRCGGAISSSPGAMLARVPLFSHLGAAEIADIMRLLRARTIEQGEILVRRGDAGVLDVFHHRRRGRDRTAEPAGAACRRHVLRRNRAAAPDQAQRHGDGDAQDQAAGARRAGFSCADRAHAGACRHVHKTASAACGHRGRRAAISRPAELAQAETISTTDAAERSTSSDVGGRVPQPLRRNT